jgi:predicted nucleic acid-binding protein
VRIAVDTSVILDVLTGDAGFGQSSREALRQAYDDGALVVCDIVWAEVRAHFPEEAPFAEAMNILGLQFDPLKAGTAAQAGALWRAQRRAAKASGVGREGRVIADFLVGAHASLQAEGLLARDRGYFRSHFKGLRVIDPSAPEKKG